MSIGIVTPFQRETRVGFSHLLVADEIRKAWMKEGVAATIYHYESREIKEPNILFVGAITASTLAYLVRFLPDKEVVFYATIEGFPIVNPDSMEKEVAKSIKIVAVSEYSKMCIETAQLPCSGVVYHGIDMDEKTYDEGFVKWVTKSWAKQNHIVLCVTANIPRKGVEKFMVLSSLIRSKRKDVKFILHTGTGSVDIRGNAAILGLDPEYFWYTGAYGVMDEAKMRAMYKLTSVYVQASHCEGFGLPMIEAMRFHVPVVAVDAQPYSEIIKNGKTGTLVPCTGVDPVMWGNEIQFNMHKYNVHEMAKAVEELLDHKKLIRMKKTIAEEKKRFDREETYPALLSYFGEPSSPSS